MRRTFHPEGSNWLARKPLGLTGHREVTLWPWAPAQSGVLVGQLKHVASLLQALVHVQPLPERLLLLLQLPADTPRTGDRLFFALRMENGSTTLAPVKASEGYDEQG